MENQGHLSARMEKRKLENLNGMQNHNERKTKNHSNKDIDPEKNFLNYTLLSRDKNLSYQKEIMDYINQNKSSKKSIRKDAVVCDEWVISSGKEFFSGLNDIQERKYFETSLKFFQDKFGKSNVKFAEVHKDEKGNPHMHLGVVPLTSDGRLSSKEVFSKKVLVEVQSELSTFLQDQGFNILRGNSSDKKHLSVEDYKEKQEEIKKVTAKTVSEAIKTTYEASDEQMKVIEDGLLKMPHTKEMVAWYGNFSTNNFKNYTEKKLKRAKKLTEKNMLLKTENIALKQENDDLENSLSENKNKVSELLNDLKKSVRSVMNPYGVDLREYEPLYFYDGISEPVFLDTCKNFLTRSKNFFAEKLEKTPIALPENYDKDSKISLEKVATKIRSYLVDNLEKVQKRVKEYVQNGHTGEFNSLMSFRVENSDSEDKILFVNPERADLINSNRDRSLSIFKDISNESLRYNFSEEKILGDLGQDAPRNWKSAVENKGKFVAPKLNSKHISR